MSLDETLFRSIRAIRPFAMVLLALVVACLTPQDASGLEASSTTGVFMSFAPLEESPSPSVQEPGEERPSDAQDTPATMEGNDRSPSPERLPATKDDTTKLAALLALCAASALAITLAALRARKRERARACERSRIPLLAIALAVALSAQPSLTPALGSTENTAARDDSAALGQTDDTARSTVVPTAGSFLGASDWNDWLAFPYGEPNALETVELVMVDMSPTPSGIEPLCEWQMVDPTTHETTIFATGPKATIPWEALGMGIDVVVSDPSGTIPVLLIVSVTERVAPPRLKGTLEISGTPDVGQTLHAVAELETAHTPVTRYVWYAGPEIGSREQVVAEGNGVSSIVVDESLHGLYVTCVLSADDAELCTGSLQASIGPVPKAPATGSVSIIGTPTLGNTITAEATGCSASEDELMPVWFVGERPGACDNMVGTGWTLALDEVEWEGTYLSCRVEVNSAHCEGALSGHITTPILFDPPSAPAITELSVSSEAIATVTVECADKGPFSPTEAVRIEVAYPGEGWREVCRGIPENGMLRRSVAIPRIAETGSVAVRAIAENSGGSSAPSAPRTLSAQLSLTVPLEAEGRVDESGHARIEPQRIVNSGTLNVRIERISTKASDARLGTSHWVCEEDGEVLFAGAFGSSQPCAQARTILPNESIYLDWRIESFETGTISLGSTPSLYGTIGYTFGMP